MADQNLNYIKSVHSVGYKFEPAYNAKQKGQVMPEKLYQWCSKSVAGILERQEYTGCTVNFKVGTGAGTKIRIPLHKPEQVSGTEKPA